MNRTQQTALATSALVVGGTLLSRARRHQRRIDFRDRSVLITGGSRGLGLLMARQLVENGASVTIVARDDAELERARVDLESRGSGDPELVITLPARFAVVANAVFPELVAGHVDGQHLHAAATENNEVP